MLNFAKLAFATIAASAAPLGILVGPASASPNFDIRYTHGGSESHTVVDFKVDREEKGYTSTFEFKAFSDQAGVKTFKGNTDGGGIKMDLQGWQGTQAPNDPINVFLGSESFMEYTETSNARGTTVTESWQGYTGFSGDFSGQ